MLFSFKSSHRVRQKKEYDRVFQARRRLFGHHFLLYYCKNTLQYPRIGVIVSKKNVRHAVDRNQLKRVARESFRLMQRDLPKVDIVILAKKTAGNANKKELHQCIHRLLVKLVE